MKQVLIVDDKEENCYYLQALFSGHGYSVDTARHGAEALVKARQSPPDVIISDLLMPVIDGYTLLRLWKADHRLSEIPFVVYTATYTEPADEQLAFSLGADGFILKPAEPESFLERVRDVLEKSKLGQIGPADPADSDPGEVLQVYSQTLIRKLEEKTLQLEEANRTLQRDFLEREKVEAAGRLAAERTRLAVKAAGAGVWDINLITGTVEWDEQMFALYGLDRNEAEPDFEGWCQLIHPDDFAFTNAKHQEMLAGECDSFDLEFRICRRDNGQIRSIRGLGLVAKDPAGKAIRIIGLNLDVTDQREREKVLAEALTHEKELGEKARAGERAKSEFLAVMSHEIRTPLNGILGFADLLVRTPELPPEAQEYARTITTSGEALLKILDDVLDFSRLEAGRVRLEHSHFSPSEILRDIHVLLAQQAIEKGLGFRVAIDRGVPESIEGDAGRIRQIVLNLTGNAIKFTSVGSVTLGLRSGLDPGCCEIFVKDTGCGIAPEQVEQIFEPFTQADSSTSRRHGGAGLGLTISKRLAALLGGTLSVTSMEGVGSEFVLTLPIGSSTPAPAQPLTSDSDPLDRTFCDRHPLRIMVVEDDAVNLKLSLHLIRRLGYTPLAAKNGRDAVEIYRISPVDCILMDLQMPEMDGAEATARIRELEATADPSKHPTFICAVTANIFPEDRRRCFESGMNDYLNKPIKLATIAKILANAASRLN